MCATRRWAACQGWASGQQFYSLEFSLNTYKRKSQKYTLEADSFI